ncbi:MAG: hypothetical protein AB7O62_17800 [Pirellulales bacterium]
MLHTIALAAAFCLSQFDAAPPAISNIRHTFVGEFGPPRATNKYVPGDVMYVVFDVDHLHRNADGGVKYSIGMEVLDAKGKAIFTVPSSSQRATLPLGGSKLPARVFLQLGPDMPPGSHALRITVQDGTSGGAVSANTAFEVLPAKFAMVAIAASFDADGQTPAPINAFVGQAIWLHLQVVGFARDSANKRPRIELKQTIFDSAGNVTHPTPTVLVSGDEPPDNQAGVPFSLALPLNRAGVFRVRLQATCKVSGQTHLVEIPVTVYRALK